MCSVRSAPNVNHKKGVSEHIWIHNEVGDWSPVPLVHGIVLCTIFCFFFVLLCSNTCGQCSRMTFQMNRWLYPNVPITRKKTIFSVSVLQAYVHNTKGVPLYVLQIPRPSATFCVVTDLSWSFVICVITFMKLTAYCFQLVDLYLV